MTRTGSSAAGVHRQDLEDRIRHCDRGVQYESICYTARLAEVGIEASVGSVVSFDDERRLEPIGDLPTAEIEAMYFEDRESSAKKAGPSPA